ncbi:MAG: ABC transporter permease subunit [Candidatus Binatia bacterium]|nr:ABC transporter permease subunit [Candidatus Binatia bacterium]
MPDQLRFFGSTQPPSRPLTWGDGVVLLGVIALLAVGIRLALGAPAAIAGPTISLAPSALPWYAAYSVGRMAAAYCLSLVFTVSYGYLAAYHRRAEYILLPLLDVLQSVPILSFLPVVLLSLSAVLPQAVAAELASIALIFTSQVWNLTFGWYQALTTLPEELREASRVFRFNGWLRFKVVELPFAAISLVWNSMMSWAGGWFFLMAAEMFTVGHRDFRLPGLGAYLQEAAHRGEGSAILWGIGSLVLVIVLLDQLVWRPLIAWSDRFTLQLVERATPPTSWVYAALRSSRLLRHFVDSVLSPASERLDQWLVRRFPPPLHPPRASAAQIWTWRVLGTVAACGLLYGTYHAALLLFAVPLAHWGMIGLGILATLLRVGVSLLCAFAWTIPVGTVIGTNPSLAAWLQPLVQIAAAIPATALFPVLLLLVLGLPGGLHLAAILLMLLGSQWYLLFNVIAGARAIPQELRYTAALLRLSSWQRWRTLLFPALFPSLVTGGITASGGAWNASIVAEYLNFGGRSLQITGIGALITEATAAGDYSLLLAATLSMVFTVVLLNRAVWRPLYRIAEQRYRLA